MPKATSQDKSGSQKLLANIGKKSGKGGRPLVVHLSDEQAGYAINARVDDADRFLQFRQEHGRPADLTSANDVREIFGEKYPPIKGCVDFLFYGDGSTGRACPRKDK